LRTIKDVAHTNELRSDLRSEFHDKEYRRIYADESLNTYIATQIKVLREQRDWTQAELAKEAGMAQPRIAVMEDINHSAWSLNTLKRLANAYDLRLAVKFESFSSLIPELEDFGRASLLRPSFADDRWFHDSNAEISATTSTPFPDFRTLTGHQLGLQFSAIRTVKPSVGKGSETQAVVYVMPKRNPRPGEIQNASKTPKTSLARAAAAGIR